MDSYEKSLQTLELPAVLALLAAQAVSETARAQAMALRPSGDRAVVATRLGETSAAASMMVVKGSPSFSGVKDVRAALQRADMGGALNTRELLDIAGVLQAARCVRSYGTGERQDKTSIDYLFSALPETFDVGRYHSWVVRRDSIPACLEVTAVSPDGQVMALRHRRYDVHGIQFHPESVLTPLGRHIISAFLKGKPEGE